MKKNKVLIIAGSNVEQVEILTPHDYLIRSGYDVDIAWNSDQEYITTSYNIKIKVDLRVKDILNRLDEYNCLFIPGGPGVIKLNEMYEWDAILNHFFSHNKVVAAICAAPLILAQRGLLKGKHAIGHSSIHDTLEKFGVVELNKSCQWGTPCEVVVDGNIVTGMEMKSSLPFAIKLAQELNKRK